MRFALGADVYNLLFSQANICSYEMIRVFAIWRKKNFVTFSRKISSMQLCSFEIGSIPSLWEMIF